MRLVKDSTLNFRMRDFNGLIDKEQRSPQSTQIQHYMYFSFCLQNDRVRFFDLFWKFQWKEDSVLWQSLTNCLTNQTIS